MNTIQEERDQLTREIIALYNIGLSLREVGAAVYLSCSAVRERLKKAGVPRRPWRKRRIQTDDPRTVKAADLYRQGATLEQAAKAVGLSRTTLTRLFEESGIYRRPKGRKISAEIVSAIRADRLAGMRPCEITRRYGVSPSTVSHYTCDFIKNGKKGGTL